MFETSLVGLQRKKGARQRWLSLPLAVALHLLVLSSLVFAQYWSVDTVPEPQVTEAFQVTLPLPPPPLAAQRGTAAPRPVPRPATPTAVPDQPPRPTQPTVGSDRPIPPPAPADDSRVGLPDGIEHGDPLGKPGGDPNGVPGGVPNSVALPDAPPPQPDEPIRYRSDMTRPQIVYRVSPQYTEVARTARLQGTVIVEAVIDEGGRVRDVQILKGLPMGLDRSAANAVAQWRFTPATLNGRPLKVIYTLTVNFTVQ